MAQTEGPHSVPVHPKVKESAKTNSSVETIKLRVRDSAVFTQGEGGEGVRGMRRVKACPSL